LDSGYRRDLSSGKAEIKRDYFLPPPAVAYLDKLLSGYHDDSKAFYTHVLQSARAADEWWVPVPVTAIRKYTYGADAEKSKLIDAGLLERTEELAAGKCYEYRIPDRYRREVVDLVAKALTDSQVESGDALKPTFKTKLYDESNHRFHEPLYSALKTLRTGRFDKNGVDSHIEGQRKGIERIVDGELDADDLLATDATARELHLRYLMNRHQNDVTCYGAIRAQAPKPVGDDEEHCEYRLAYSVTSTGRISQLGGGLQSCSREMKAAAYNGLKNVYNYDIRSSQAYILRAVMEEADYEATWLEKYLSADKVEYADRVGISVGTWKECMYAILFGALLSLSDNHLGESLSVKGILVQGEQKERLEAGVPPQESMRAAVTRQFESLKEVIDPFYFKLRKWRKYLAEKWLDQHKSYSKAGWSVRNAAGATLRQADYERWSPSRRRAKLASFVLQGKEAGFIHTLTALLPDHGITPISNEHDGIVTVEQIPQDVIDEVKRELDMGYVELVEKSFV
jgi:hypothetical protein